MPGHEPETGPTGTGSLKGPGCLCLCLSSSATFFFYLFFFYLTCLPIFGFDPLAIFFFLLADFTVVFWGC